jgi:hypothetical protein
MARALEAIAKRPTFENKESLGHPAMPEGPPLKIKIAGSFSSAEKVFWPNPATVYRLYFARPGPP